MNSLKTRRNRAESSGSKSKISGMGKMNIPRTSRHDDSLLKKDSPEMIEQERYPKDEL